jgi:hypothetical protein
MPTLERSEWYQLSRDMNWQFKYVSDAEVFPEALSESKGISPSGRWNWDEPYKISYREECSSCSHKRRIRWNHKLLSEGYGLRTMPSWLGVGLMATIRESKT